jgi:transcriptional regulator with XRE-family HTH domain
MAAKAIGERIRARRRELKQTQDQLATIAGIGQSALSSIERGYTKELRAETLLGLSRGLGKSPEWIQTGAEAAIAVPVVPDAEFRALLAQLDPRHRQTLLEIGRSLVAQQQGRATVADPFPGVPKPSKPRPKVAR